MNHRRFGRTNLQVPAITFGGGWVGGVLIHDGEAPAMAALDMAWGGGIDWIDTAADYGKGVSETMIGRWLVGRAAADRPRVSTKFRLDPEAGDLKGQMMKSVEASLDRLGLGKVEVIILHNQIDAEGHRGSRSVDAKLALEMAETMEALREQGLCDWLGMTALGDPAAVASVVDAGRFDVAQVYYNMLNPTAAVPATGAWNTTDFAGLLGRCKTQDMGVMGIRIFAGGHLASDQRHGREIPITVNADDTAEEARTAALWSEYDPAPDAPAQAALRFGLACRDLSTIVVGLGTLDHLSLALAAEAKGALPDEVLARLDQIRQGAAFTA
ncbi:MAG: aldo/keto reductase [Pseudomonadota bacterium]